ncbi:MAG: metalloregulator ArsR/SmtB family transcription factor [bacterium]
MPGGCGRRGRGWGGGRMMRLMALETRQRIFDLLGSEPRTVGDLARRLGISQPAVSQHLAALREAGFVLDERRGQCVYYALVPETAARFRLGCSAFGWGRPAGQSAEQLESYREFLKAETERVERDLKRRKSRPEQDV